MANKTMIKCPNCGAYMEFETYRKVRPGHYPPLFCYFCPNGDFITDDTYPTKAIEEINSASKWNAQRHAVM